MNSSLKINHQAGLVVVICTLRYVMISWSLLTIVWVPWWCPGSQGSPQLSVLSVAQKGSYVAACPVLHIVWPGLSLSASSTLSLDCTLEYGFGQGLMTGDMTIPGKLAALRCCKEQFLIAHIGGNLLPNIVVCLVFLVGDVEKLSEALDMFWASSIIRRQLSAGKSRNPIL